MGVSAEDRTGKAAPFGSQIWPWHGWLGLGLIAIFWTLNWGLEGPRTHWGFFPLWLGYSLTVDALCVRRKGDSLLTRSPSSYVFLFLISVPSWWLFELINERTQNWIYMGNETFGFPLFLFFSSLSFSTVMPAVFGTAELVATFPWIERFRRGPVVGEGKSTVICFFVMGVCMLGLLLAWPRYFFPLVWLSVYFILEPINVALKGNSLLSFTARGDWRPVIALWTGCLICGFFWEMWNFYSWPKWIYHVPFVGFLHVFEMPLLGYGGYLPFALELYALYQLIARLGGEKQTAYLRIVS
ncbi:MAG: hypothetical protein PHY31_05905 [Smithellaceae bacterium]|nr:hypothetical protein [Smithellaceae bacterium]